MLKITLVRHGRPDEEVADRPHDPPLLLSPVLGLPCLVHFRPGHANLSRLLARDASKLGVVSINESGHHAWPEPVTP